MGEIASQLVAVLQRQPPSVWSTVRFNDEHWLEFVISHHGMEQWRQQLIDRPWSGPAAAGPSLAPSSLWNLQAGYELCCRWQTLHRTLDSRTQSTSQLPQLETQETPDRAFQPPPMSSVLGELIHELLEICDRTHDEGVTATQLLHQVRGVIIALERCVRVTPPGAAAAPQLSHWLTPTQKVLHQLLHQRWGYPLPERF